ncbi:hypothetical protein ACFV0O_04840 [Kitasatospora sp. NPDC059577]|uniref:hypothetical protein n=1 Tax=Kitasatospora sp. NPDC059577 TaxID=3346873 RepID=UPI0036D1D8A9
MPPVFAAVENRTAHPVLDLSALHNRRLVGLRPAPVAASSGFVTMPTRLPSHPAAGTGRGRGALAAC